MKKRCFIYIFLALGLLLLTGCRTSTRSIARFQRQLEKQQVRALEGTYSMVEALGVSLDSTRAVAARYPDVLFFVFDGRGMVYWSDNRLSSSHVYLDRYDHWTYRRFDNAHTISRWTQAGDYHLLTVIPVKFAYPFSNQQLKNSFVSPLRLSDEYDVIYSRAAEGVRVESKDGDYLFTLQRMSKETREEVNARLSDSFSYQGLLSVGDPNPSGTGHLRVFLFSFLTVLLFMVFIVWGIVGLVRARGWRNLKIVSKFQYMLVLVLLTTFAYVFLVTLRYTGNRYRERQEQVLQQKARYIQKSLQDLYYWNVTLNELNTQGLNVCLRDLCFVYETDINVYGVDGRLLGSSSPALFDYGITSRHMASEPFFSGAKEQLYREKIGQTNYLASYIELVNGSFVPIGYISVPFYVSNAQIHKDIDEFLGRMFPAYLLVLVLCLAFGLTISRQMTRSFNDLSENMRQFRIGQHNARLVYPRKDEVGVIVEQYNQMADKLEESAERLARSEREGAWRTMARQIAHEINNPLTPMKLSIQQMRRLHEQEDERFDVYFNRSTLLLMDQIDDLSHIASSFSSFAKMPEVIPMEVDVAERLFAVISLFRNNQHNTPIRYVGAEQGVLARTDEKQIAEVFTNLIKNALQAIDANPEGDIIVILKERETEVEISVSDNGGGIPPEVQDKVFVPNFTTKSAGTGLGLAICKHIVDGSGGDIRFETSPQGTTFFVVLKK